MNKFLKSCAAATMALAMVGCSQGQTEGEGEKANIGIIQYAEHPALDQAYEGFVEGLKENGYDTDAVEIDYKNAQGDQSNNKTIANTFVNDNVDLIYAIATPSAQAAANETKDIPIVVSAVTDPQTSGLVKSNDKPDTNVTGTSDLNPIDAQIDLLKQMVPNAKKIAIMYCNAEDNSRFQADLAKKKAEDLDLEVVEATVTDSNQIQQVTESLVGKVDAIYVPTDNLLAEGMASLTQVTNANKIPTIVGEEGMVANGGLATYGLDYYELGKMAGKPQKF
ncbi:ABC transporter substrate-binding protein [Dubosiella newyorkensis]|jgi:putative ABC transport system substrate-binding protein|uniref:ABC transporter substrate-binding protein n=1 Tax=Dubosiella newyorkensis TaxID=1862672 RepID=UPI0025AD45D8|nr:ABC transporter substrate-binding protein [Dubosiella newyorkensis]